MNQPTTPHTPKPTAKQMRYLKALAEERGQSFTYPKTKTQASAEIDRLHGAKKTPSADARRERRLRVLLRILGGQDAPDLGALSQPNRRDASPKSSSSSVLRPSARSSSRIRASAA